MDVSIIIVNYNTKQLTEECIRSIVNNTKNIIYEIILVDNASTDGSKELFENDNRLKYIYSCENLGFGRANNLGYEYSSGKYIFLLNSDTILLNNAIKEFYDFAESINYEYACIGTILKDKDGRNTHSSAIFPTLKFFIIKFLNNYTRFFGKDLTFKFFNTFPINFPAKVDYVTGADLFIKKSVIKQFGMFHPLFFMYYEETEMQKRYKENGYFSLLIDKPQIMHLCGGSRKKKSLNGWRLDLEGSFIYSKFHLSFYKYYILRVLAVIILLPKILFYRTNVKDKLKTIETLLCRIDIKGGKSAIKSLWEKKPMRSFG